MVVMQSSLHAVESDVLCVVATYVQNSLFVRESFSLQGLTNCWKTEVAYLLTSGGLSREPGKSTEV